MPLTHDFILIMEEQSRTYTLIDYYARATILSADIDLIVDYIESKERKEKRKSFLDPELYGERWELIEHPLKAYPFIVGKNRFKETILPILKEKVVILTKVSVSATFNEVFEIEHQADTPDDVIRERAADLIQEYLEEKMITVRDDALYDMEFER